MKVIIIKILLFIITVTICRSYLQKQEDYSGKVLYKSKNLIVTQIASNSFVHTSFKQTKDFGYVGCNGLIVRDGSQTIVFDTLTNDASSRELIKWLHMKLHCEIVAVIPTHFHDDCLGGLAEFHSNTISSYAFNQTIKLAKENGYTVPENSFSDSLTLLVGDQSVIIKFFGEGHTKDNVVGYFPSDNVMFGGCLTKALGSGKGYLGDATVEEWSNTVEKVKKAYPDVKIVVPGHGKYGDKKLLDYTITLFKLP